MPVAPDSNEPKPQSDWAPAAEAPEPVLAPSENQIVVTDIPRQRAWVCAVGAALIAAFLAWGIGEKMYDYYRPSGTGRGDPRDFSAMNREKLIADQKNTAIASGTFGALIGLLFGLAGGALGRSIPGAASAALAGLLLGGIGGTLVGYELAPIFARFYSDEDPSLLLSFLVRGAIWAVIGMSAGLALGGGWHSFAGIRRTLLGGLAGSVIGTMAFETVNAIVFPSDRNDAVIPTAMWARLLAYLLVSAGVAVGAVLLERQRLQPAKGTPQSHP
jgi:hypothetical protein